MATHGAPWSDAGSATMSWQNLIWAWKWRPGGEGIRGLLTVAMAWKVLPREATQGQETPPLHGHPEETKCLWQGAQRPLVLELFP